MPKENKLNSPNTVGPHQGHFGEAYDQMGRDRYIELKPAIANWIRVLEKQLSAPDATLSWTSSNNRATSGLAIKPSLTAQEYNSVANARQAVYRAVEQAEGVVEQMQDTAKRSEDA